jgi:SagB-type dehydrogenase family enzyme
MLWSGGFLTTRDQRTGITADDAPPLIAWEFHDLLFHSRTRRGRHAAPYGATDRLRIRADLPPAVKPARPEAELIPLRRPDLKRLTLSDWTLTQALEQRRSHRQHATRSIKLDQLSELLYRSAGTRPVHGRRPAPLTRRVYPSGGATYSLEVYVTARACKHLDPGLYRYCSNSSELEKVSGMTSDVLRLVDGAAMASGCQAPQVLVTIAARFLRVSWKYSSLSYALILKEVGALQQTMYLVATAMGLGACAIGGGDSDLFARAAGASYYEEGAVGELLLGTRLRSR